MKLTKVNVTEGIKLSDVKDNEYLYEKYPNRIHILWIKYEHEISRSIHQNICIIRDNKVIPIIKDEEYDNEQPYLIGKDENHIAGIIDYNEQGYCNGINLRYRAHLYYNSDICNYYEDINILIKDLNKIGLNVYKQK